MPPADGTRDLTLATRNLTERLPGALAPLARIAFNYRWSWLPDGGTIFSYLDPHLWERSGCNPRWLIEALPPRRLRDIAADSAYVARIRRAAEVLAADLARPPQGPGPVAYFCSEFGVHCSLPLYSGGLGVLAGDVLKAASDAALPMIGVGLLYRQGYFRQRIDGEGWQREYWITTDFERVPAVLVTDAQDRPLTVEVPLRGRTVRVQVWRVDVGRVPLYLLDTDRTDNHPIDRWITARLYIGDRLTRLAQYGVLGVGGVRALAAMGIEPALVHLNEGHAALGGLERVRIAMEQGRTADEALEDVRAHTVFTTHTPVEAGNEWYSPGEVEPVLGGIADSLGSARHLFYDLGRTNPGNQDEPVCTTVLALRTSRGANGVSERHGEVARHMWQRLWPGRATGDVPIRAVTNGVHTPTWMASAMQNLFDRHLPATWRDNLADPALQAQIAAIPDAELWALRRTLRERLVDYVRAKSIRDRLGRNERPDYVEAAADVFDPDVRTIGFARRVATYKRLYLFARQLDRGLRLLSNVERPLQIVVAGKAHPNDGDAKQALRDVFALRSAPEVGRRIVFLEDYDLHMAPRIVAGADVWVNLPRPPLEASGTSGMKAAANGGVHLSVLDGWWVEAQDGDFGWTIHTPDADPNAQDEHDATALMDLLEHQVVPSFYERDAAGLPTAWLARMKRSMQVLIPRFSAARMVHDYVDRLYAPRQDD